MTHNEAVEILASYIAEKTEDMRFPVKVEKGDTEQVERAPEVHKMRLPHSSDAKKIAPYVIVRYVSSNDKQDIGRESKSEAIYRFIFCVYDDNEETGSLNLLNLMDRVKISILKDTVIGQRIRLKREEGLEMISYEDDTWPYYAGEIIVTFEYGPIEREVYDEKDYRNSIY